MSLSQKKKLAKKLLKLQHILERETGIKKSSTSTKHLAICNAGLVSGLNEDILFRNFSKHGPIADIIMIPGKSCCFISYETLPSSESAYNTFNGKLNIAQDDKPIFLLYVDEVPANEEHRIWGETPSGLRIIENFIDETEEQFLLSLCTFDSGASGEMKHRQVKHFGYEFRYDINNVDNDKPLSDPLPRDTYFLWTKLGQTYQEFKTFKPDQLTINQYLPGQGIPHHIDTHSAFEDPIVCLSLGSPIVMEFKNEQRHICSLLPQRSLLIMSGESRYNWTHGIVPRKFDVVRNNFGSGFTCLKRDTRVSFTFRKVLHGECKCIYKSQCDSHKKENALNDNIASRLESLHVHSVYESIADHFSGTRHKPWPNVLEFVQSFGYGNVVVDVGCGNGKYLSHNKKVFDVGCDYSSGLIEICNERKFSAFIGDCLSIPVKDNFADGVISIAVIHHLATEQRRLKAIQEIFRILNVGGRALIYVWAHDQIKNDKKSSYIMQDRKNRKGADGGKNSIVTGDWTGWINERIFRQTRRTCGYYFDHHNINKDGNNGNMHGHCKCESQIYVSLHRTVEDVMEIKCEITEGTGSCKKVYLRGKRRKEIGELVYQKGAYIYRIEEAENIMNEGEKEPPTLPSAAVLRTACAETLSSKYVDKNPAIALQILQQTIMQYTIINVGLSQFFVHYTTRHQESVYKALAKDGMVSISIDATGSIIKKNELPNQQKSGPIFLYIAVARTMTNSVPVAQMLSERHTTNSINFWLGEWILSAGLPFPKEVICDGSRALLGACVRQFTNCHTINEYSNYLTGERIPQCYIRMDVAHFMKKYADFLGNIRKEIKRFYMAVIGRLVLSDSIENSTIILKALFVVALSETDGPTKVGEPSICEIKKAFLYQLIAENNFEEAEYERVENIRNFENDEEVTSATEVNLWQQWGLRIKSDAESEIKGSEGNGVNAHWLPDLATYVIKDLRWLPLWSCVVRNNFGYGRFPASSAPVETEFRNIKRLLLKNANLPIRADAFVEMHSKYINGLTKIYDAAATSSDQEQIHGLSDSGDKDLDIQPESDIFTEIEISKNTKPKNSRKTYLSDDHLFNLPSQQNDLYVTKCPACKNGDLPGGAHTCIICGIAVHIIAGCSLPFSDEEGYGEKRICRNCNVQPNAKEIIESRAIENWKGQAEKTVPQKRCSMYLNAKFPAHKLQKQLPLKKIPILKSGEDRSLQPLTVSNGKIDVINTCAFDSLFQLLLTASIDSTGFFSCIKARCDSSLFFRLIERTVVNNKVTAETYKLRKNVLQSMFNKFGNSDVNCYVIDCNTTTTTLVKQLIGPCIQETRKCGCGEKVIDHSIMMVQDTSLIDQNFNIKIEENLKESNMCSKCLKFQDISLQLTEMFLLFEVVTSNGSDPSLKLSEIPKKINLGFTKKEMVLIGIINWKSPNQKKLRARASDSENISNIGHYTSFVVRNNHQWFQFDHKEKKVSEATKVSPQLVLYVNNESIL